MRYFFRRKLYKFFLKLNIIINKIKSTEFSHESFNNVYLRLINKFKKNNADIINGYKIRYSLSSDIGLLLFLNGNFEQEELKICGNYLKVNSIVFDIGANIGTHSIYFSSIVKEGLIFAFEPSLKTFSLLTENVKNIDNIYPLNFALSNKNGILDYYEAEDCAYSGLKDTKRKKIISLRKVLCYKLDYLFYNLGLTHIDFIKIDVEGFENEVLEGMSKIITDFMPIIFCEIYGGKNSNIDPLQTISRLKKMGYEVYVIKNGVVTSYENHDDNFHNYLFIPT